MFLLQPGPPPTPPFSGLPLRRGAGKPGQKYRDCLQARPNVADVHVRTSAPSRDTESPSPRATPLNFHVHWCFQVIGNLLLSWMEWIQARDVTLPRFGQKYESPRSKAVLLGSIESIQTTLAFGKRGLQRNPLEFNQKPYHTRTNFTYTAVESFKSVYASMITPEPITSASYILPK